MRWVSRFLLLLLLCSNSFFFAQNSTPTVSLPKVFTTLESRWDVTFSYQNSNLKGHQLSTLPTFTTLANALSYLENNTLFQYTLLPDGTITVAPRNNLISLCGILREIDTGTLVTKVTVRTPYQEVQTEDSGQFNAVALTPEDLIVIYSEGKELTRFKASVFASGCPQTFVFGKIEKLDEVLITSYLSRGITKNTNGSLTVDYNEFDILPGLIEPDVLQTIQALPGIQSIEERVSFLNIRGGTNDQNLILLDGVKMYQSGHFFGLISAFNPFLTQRVTVVKNGTPAAYGDGVSGMISMESSRRINDSISAELGTNLISSDGFADIPLGAKASVQIAARSSINQLWESPTYSAYFDRVFQNTEVISNSETQSVSDARFQFFDASTRFLYQPTEKDRIRFNFLGIGNRIEFVESAIIDDNFIARQSDLKQNNLALGLYYERDWSPTLSTYFQAYFSDYSLDSTNEDVVNDQQLSQENNVLENGFRLAFREQRNPSLTYTYGYQFNETGITNFEGLNNPIFRRTDKQVLRTHSVFGDVTYKTRNGATSLVVGLRSNYIDKFGTLLLEPRLNFSQRFLSYFTFEVLGEFKSQTTSQIIDFQNDFLGVENRRWVLSNPNSIPILKGRQISTGVSYSRRGWQVSIEPYWKEVTGITSQSQRFQNQFASVRANGNYEVVGVDVLLNKRFDQINTWLSYSWAQNTYDFPLLTPSEFLNNLDVTHSLTYGIDYHWKQFNFAGGLNWRTGKPTTNPIEGNEIENGVINYSRPNSDRIKDYFRVDLSATYQFALGRTSQMFLGASVWNLLNTKNTINQFYRINASGNIEQVNEPALSFTPNATLRVMF
ncbi:TonB-dependent receptor plug domain-containing protein [Altibacter sp. HG106]|uniref:TonB-dependent receptor plug domain-containing protein n=1 Tax=Altibacter sp. HG106 TaxID=3023937 RepID=UPI002350F206|nr:TonB-dependent receptor plug domain-containing protein [Altibacter sp. HG106]MDC7996041.1 TonB-dependent receptor plug domain-containing protein [Altibacter sp. HG106]